MDNILISIKSFEPQNFIGWPEVAIEIYKKKNAKVLCANDEDRESLIKSNTITKNQINPKDIYKPEQVEGISDTTLILLEPFRKSLIPEGFKGKLVVSLCGFKKEILIKQINELKGIPYELLLSEYTHDELFVKDIHNTDAILDDKYYFIPPAITTKQKNNKIVILYNNGGILDSVTKDLVTQRTDDIVKKVLTETGKIELLDLGRADNEYYNLDSSSKILSLVNYPQLDFLSFIKDVISNKNHICNDYPKFSLIRQIFFCDFETETSINIFLNESIRNLVLKLLKIDNNADSKNNFSLEEFTPSRISDFILSEYQNSNFEKPLSFINSISSNFELVKNDFKNLHYPKSEHAKRLCKTSFDIAAFEQICNSSKISERNLIEHIFREELTNPYTTNSVILTSKILEKYADNYFKLIESEDLQNNFPYKNLYYSLLTNQFSAELIERAIHSIKRSNDKQLLLLLPNLYLLLGKKESGYNSIDKLLENKNIGITHFYHSLTAELCHPNFHSTGREIISYIIDNYYKSDTSYDIKSTLCWANAFSSIQCFDKGYQIISSLVDSNRIPEIYLFDYFVTSLCFLSKDEIVNNQIRTPDIHQVNEKVSFNYLAIYLLDGKIKESEIIIRHILHSFSTFEEVGKCSLNKLIPFLLYGLTTSNQQIIDIVHNIINFNSFAAFPIDYKKEMRSKHEGCDDTQQKLIKFLS